MEKYCEDIAISLKQCGEETQRISTFADNLINLEIQDRWWGDDWAHYNGYLMVSTAVFVECLYYRSLFKSSVCF